MEDGFPLEHSTVGIIGLGLMGGSLAMSLKGKCARLIGFDSLPPTLELALSKKIIDQALLFPAAGRVAASFVGAACRDHNIDILILATPVQTILDLLHRLQDTNYQLPITIQYPCIVMDLGSTKRDILQAMSTLPDNFDPIGGHPICGKEKLGLENAEADLYQNAPFVLTPLERTTQRARSAAQQILSAIGANCLEMTAEEHDRILASTSHLPFLLSSSLAHSIPHSYTSLIGPGFRSASRLAGTPSHMMMGILKSNRDNVLSAIRSFRDSLNKMESALQDEDYSELETLLNQSRDSYQLVVE